MKSPTATTGLSSLSQSRMAPLPLFVYGTLMAPSVIESLIGRRIVGQKVKLLPSTTTAITISEPEMEIKQPVPYDYSRHPVLDVVYPGLVHWNEHKLLEMPPSVQNVLNTATSSQSYVTGLLYSNLSTTELQILDDFEGDQYSRELCQVQLLQEVSDNKSSNPLQLEQQQAMVYVWSNSLSELDLTQDWSYETFVSKHLSTYIDY